MPFGLLTHLTKNEFLRINERRKGHPYTLIRFLIHYSLGREGSKTNGNKKLFFIIKFCCRKHPFI